jgi:hypothetical protein
MQQPRQFALRLPGSQHFIGHTKSAASLKHLGLVPFIEKTKAGTGRIVGDDLPRLEAERETVGRLFPPLQNRLRSRQTIKGLLDFDRWKLLKIGSWGAGKSATTYLYIGTKKHLQAPLRYLFRHAEHTVSDFFNTPLYILLCLAQIFSHFMI